MRQLRFVRLTEDGTRLVLHSPEGVEDFSVALDPSLRRAVAGAPPVQQPTSAPAAEPAGEPPAAESYSISPREIQLRVRSGESPEQVAQSLGAPLDRIMRFAAAVVDERRRITEEARRSRARQTSVETVDGKVVPFGEAVNERFTAHGISPAEVRWDSHRREDGEWVVIARWIGGTGEHEAQWLFSRSARMVTPVDSAAADLLNDRPIRPVTPPAPPRLVVAPPLAPGVVAFPPMPDARTGPIETVEEEVFDQEAQPSPRPPRFLRETRRAQAPRPDAAEFVDPVDAVDTVDTATIDFDVPPLPLGTETGETAPTVPTSNRSTTKRERVDQTSSSNRPAPKNKRVDQTSSSSRPAPKGKRADRGRAGKPRVPAWDDIVLGVRRSTD